METGLLYLMIGFMSVQGSSGLDCFKCVSAWTNRECMQQDPETCGWGQICYNTVERGGFSGVKYTKGCMSDTHCYSLQNLNTGSSCDQNPSICVYCCEGELCNEAAAQLPVSVISLMTSLLTSTLFS